MNGYPNIVNAFFIFQMSVEDGKVFFTVSELEPAADNCYENMFDLKTAERIFVTVTHFPTCDIKGDGMGLIILPVVHAFVVVVNVQWSYSLLPKNVCTLILNVYMYCMMFLCHNSVSFILKAGFVLYCLSLALNCHAIFAVQLV